MSQAELVPTSELSIRAEAAIKCRERISTALHGASVAFFDMSMGLLEAFEQDYAHEWGFKSFADYVESELDMKYRTAYYMVEIGKTVRRLGLNAERIQQIGWTKMREITNALNENPDESEKYLRMAETMSHRELKDAIQSEVSVRAATEGKLACMRLSLKFEGDSASMLSDALALAQADIGKEDVNLALAHMAGEWLMARGGGAQASTLENWIDFIRKTFGVNLVRAEQEEDLDVILTDSLMPNDTDAVASELSGDAALDELLN